MGLGDLTEDYVREACNQKSYGRGRTYHRAGRVLSVKWDAGGVKARVRGTRTYRVELEDSEDSGVPYHCTCPYDWGGACKHVVAVMLHVLDHVAEAPRAARAALGDIASMITAASPEYTREFLAGEMQRNPSVAKRFGAGIMWDAAAGTNHAKKINALFSGARPRGGPARRLDGWDREIDLGPFIAVASRFERAGDYGEAARVYGQIADAAAANAGRDESYDGVIRESIRRAGLCAAGIKGGTKKDGGARIREMLGRYRAADDRFRGDCEAALLSACAAADGPAHLLAAVKPHVPRGARARKGARGGRRAGAKGPPADEEGGRMLALKAVAMEGLGDGDAAEKMLAGHAAATPETYAMYAEHLDRAGERGRAARVAEEGIDRLGDGDDRLVDAALGTHGPDWERRYALLERAYVRSRDPARLELLRAVPSAWPASCRRLIAEFEKDREEHPERVLGLLLGEGMYKRAMRVLADAGDAEILSSYRSEVAGWLPRSYLLAYQYAIEKEAAGARNAQCYRNVVRHLDEMARVPGEEARARARELAESLRKKYAKRNAFAAILESAVDDM